MAQAVHKLGVAAILPSIASSSLNPDEVRAVPLSFLSALSREVSLVWSRKMAEVRPALTKYAGLFAAMFRLEKERF